ncbi:MAG: LacI family DNA-binding transcriptional regulator [Hyphomicrobiales bacterium]|nr:LacI family DNA-binding transcriptional regulator [Hyphomicrobiales bacterium]
MPNGRKSAALSRAVPAAIGLRDVAKAAGVSTATVSRAMNMPEVVSPELRERIAAVARDLGWVPHGAARALATRRSGAIGAVFPTLSHGDFARAAEALQGELTAHGYTLLLACSQYDLAQEYRLVRQFVERGVDAIALVGTTHEPELTTLLERQRVPYVNTFNYTARRRANSVGPDNRKAMRQLTNHLIAQGHRRFGVIAQSVQNNDRATARLQGIKDALAEAGLAIRPNHFAEGRWTIAEGRTLFASIVARKPWPTAVICGNAYLAVGAVLEALSLGIKLPQDMSIVGYDDVEIMRELPVPITTLRVRSDEVGRRTARYLVAAINGRPADIERECDVEIVERASSGPPPRSRKAAASRAGSRKGV